MAVPSTVCRRALDAGTAVVSGAALVLVGAAPATAVLVGAAPAPAAAEFSCRTPVAGYKVGADSRLTAQPHLEPEKGWFSWGPTRNLPETFTGRTFGGPGGSLYTVAGQGQLRRFVDTGSGWQNFGGTPYQVVADGFDPQSRPVTADSTGDLYAVDAGGNLRWHAWNATTHKIDATGVVLESGWGRHRDITAAGPGVLYTLTADGNLQINHFHPRAQRTGPSVAIPGWTRIRDIFSPGGDVLYAVRDDGVLFWHRFDRKTGDWADPTNLRIGTGWSAARYVSTSTDACTAPYEVPVRPPVAGDHGRAVAFESDGQLRVVHTTIDGKLRDYRADPERPLDGVARMVVGSEGATGDVNAAPQADGSLRLITQGTDASLRTFTAAPVASGWSTASDFGGWTAVDATLVRAPDGLIHSFTADPAGTWLHRVQQAPNSDRFRLWTEFEWHVPLASAPTALRSGDSVRLVAVGRDGIVRTATLDGATGREFQELRGVDARGSAAVAERDGRVVIAVRDSAGAVRVLRQQGNGTFGNEWQKLPGIDAAQNAFTARNTPAIAFSAAGDLVVASLDTRGGLNLTRQAAGGTAWAPWDAHDNIDEFLSAPTMATVGGTAYAIVRDDSDTLFVYRAPGAAARADAAASNSWVGGPVRSQVK